jgi:cellulose biosynthesis protein BcsQ
MKQELKLVSFIGQKGGVGKSSLARLLSVGAACSPISISSN